MKKRLIYIITTILILIYLLQKRSFFYRYLVKICKFIIQMNTLQIGMSLFIFLIIFTAIAYIKMNNFKTKEFINNNSIQIFLILLFISIFNVAALISDIVKVDKTFNVLWQAIVIWIITLAFSVVVFERIRNNNFNIGKIKEIFLKHRSIIAILSFIILIRVPMLWTMQRWDASEYYYGLGNACSKYQFTLSSFLKNFRLSQHSNLGFSFIMGIAEFLNPRGIVGVLIWNLILTVIAMYCVYELVYKKWLNGCSKFIAATITLAVSCSPIFLGTFAYFNVDYLLALFLIFVIYLEYKQWYVLMFFCSVILSQTKETGVVVVFGYFSYKIFRDFFRMEGNIIQRVFTYFRYNYIWVMLYTSALYALEIVRLGAVTTWVQSQDSTVSIGSFEVNLEYIIYKLKQLFILNFTWLLVFIVIICMIVFIYYRIFLKKIIRIDQYSELFGANFAFVVFSVIYVTYTLHRYNVIFEISFAIFVFCFFYQVYEGLIGKKIYCVIVYILTLLFIGQSFFSLDKLSEKEFGTVSTISSQMTVSSYILPFNGDGFVTNYQYSWLDRAFNKLLQTINYNSDKHVYLTNRQVSATQINGSGKYKVGYDTIKKKRIIMEKKDEEYAINTIASYNIFTRLPFKYYKWNTNKKINDSAVMFFIPYYEENIDNELLAYRNYCYITDTKEVETFGGILYYNELIKKDSYTPASILDLKNATANNSLEFNSSLESLVYEELLNSDWNANNINDYYNNNLLLDFEKIKQTVGRDIIQAGDMINVNIEVYDDKGVKLDTRYIGNYKSNIYKNVIVGENVLINEIYKKLIGAKLNNTYEVVCEIPKDYENLQEFKKKKLTFLITPLEITGYVKYSQVTGEDKNRILKNTINEIWEDISDNIKRKILCDTIQIVYDYNLEEIDKQKRKIDSYLNGYWERGQISKEKYLKDFLKCSDSEFEDLKQLLAEAAIREIELDKILQGYKKYYEKLNSNYINDSNYSIETVIKKSYEYFKK